MPHKNTAVKLGIIGCGRVTETRHLPSLQNLPEAEVVAVADVNPECLDRVAQRFRIKKRYTEFTDLLSDPEIEAVGICAPARFHVQIALAALEAEKHVFVEKPLALSLPEADRLIERASRSSRKVMVGFNLRWHRLVRQARERIRRGVLGPLQLMRTVLTSHYESVPEWRKRRNLGGGVLFEMAVHHFDLWRFLLDTEVEEVSASALSGQWEDEAAAVMARMGNGVLATAVFSERTSETDELEVYGEAGRLRVSCYHFDGLEYFSRAAYSGDLRTRLRQIAHTLKESPRGMGGICRGGDFIRSYEAEWRHFIDAIRFDRVVESTLEDGRRALQVVLACVASACLRKSVSVVRAPESVTAGATERSVVSHEVTYER